MNNGKYIPDKNKYNLFIEFVKENPNGNYEEYRKFTEDRKTILDVLNNK